MIRLLISFALVASIALAVAPGLPANLEGYQNWIRLNIDRVTEDPSGAHPPSKDVYINLAPEDFLAQNGSFDLPFPEGTLVIKERNDTTRLLVDRIYVMEKVEGAWEYSFFDREDDGSFTAQMLGADNFCRECHAGAKDTDYVFTSYQTR
jgi:hypothetical protein